MIAERLIAQPGDVTPVPSDQVWLRSKRRKLAPVGSAFSVVDLFCGCGGLTVGLEEAARRRGYGLTVNLAVDLDPVACAVYKSNFFSAPVVAADVQTLFPGEPGSVLHDVENSASAQVPATTFLLGGPPCEGHSDLNNHTRRRDPKNALYLRMARAAEVLNPDIVVIENVPAVLSDHSNVVGATTKALLEAGFRVHGDVVEMVKLGVPQRRRRYILIASRVDVVDPVDVLDEIAKVRRKKRDLRWAIGDLERIDADREIDRPSRISADNAARIDYLFNHRLFDLPNSERPRCHRDEDHSYKSMYGRMHWDEPAQTLTTGFTSMGQGRYVHPSKRRTITPHEAARIQTFPDYFDWTKAGGRTMLSTMIGNAVPPLMMLRLGEALITRLEKHD